MYKAKVQSFVEPIVNVLATSKKRVTNYLGSTDLREANVDCVTLGQYMQPTRLHLKVT